MGFVEMGDKFYWSCTILDEGFVSLKLNKSLSKVRKSWFLSLGEYHAAIPV